VPISSYKKFNGTISFINRPAERKHE
jgi:hypothetical protein